MIGIAIDSSRSRGKEGKEGRAPSAASTLTLTPSIGGVGKGMKAQSSSFPSLKSFAVKYAFAIHCLYNPVQIISIVKINQIGRILFFSLILDKGGGVLQKHSASPKSNGFVSHPNFPLLFYA